MNTRAKWSIGAPRWPAKRTTRKPQTRPTLYIRSTARSTRTQAFRDMSRPASCPNSPKKAQRPGVERGDTFLNHRISSVRIIVEHVIAGVKRCRIVKDVLRLTKTGISDMGMEIACGLHNLRVSCRHPLPTFDVLRFINSS